MDSPCGGCAVRAQCQPYGEEYMAADGVFVKEMRIPKADTLVPQHSHAYDHTSYVARGEVDVYCDGQPVRHVKAPAPVFVPAGTLHTFRSRVDDTLVLCIHNASRTGRVEIKQEAVGFEES